MNELDDTISIPVEESRYVNQCGLDVKDAVIMALTGMNWWQACFEYNEPQFHELWEFAQEAAAQARQTARVRYRSMSAR